MNFPIRPELNQDLSLREVRIRKGTINRGVVHTRIVELGRSKDIAYITSGTRPPGQCFVEFVCLYRETQYAAQYFVMRRRDFDWSWEIEQSSPTGGIRGEGVSGYIKQELLMAWREMESELQGVLSIWPGESIEVGQLSIAEEQ